MAEKPQDSTTKELIRYIVGALRPELRNMATKIVGILPEPLRKVWVGRVIGAFAQFVEKRNIFGLQESISDMIEIIADEIGKQIQVNKERVKRELNLEQIKNLLLQRLEQARQKISEAENISSALEKEKKILEAETELLIAYITTLTELNKKIEGILPPEKAKKIDWNKIFQVIYNKLGKLKNAIRDKAIALDEKAEEIGRKIKRIRRKIRSAGLIKREDLEE